MTTLKAGDEDIAKAAQKNKKALPKGTLCINLKYGGVLRIGANLFRAKLVSSALTLAQTSPRSPYQKNRPLIYFFEIPPSYFSFLVEKGRIFWWRHRDCISIKQGFWYKIKESKSIIVF